MVREDLCGHICRICGADDLVAIEGYCDLPRVTSDSKPWPRGGSLTVCGACGAMQKRADAVWLDEIDRIYGNYEIYYQSGGAEQPIFANGNGIGVPRSQKLIEHLVERMHLPEHGRLLDFGCGTGVALRNFAKARPNWQLNGSELSNRALP